MKKIGMISLGCPKNRVDAEMMLDKLKNAGYQITSQAEGADLVIVNTCGFIDDAKKEAIDAILSVAELKAQGKVGAIAVTGCLAQRYKQQVMDEMPEVDAVLGIGANGDIVKFVGEILDGQTVSSFPSKLCLPLDGGRLVSTPGYFAYLKIAEGCSNRCAYCAIPAIRGKYRSRTMDEIVREAETLASNGVKELVLVAQDVTKYGIDLYDELKLPELLKRLCKIDGIKWIRLLYCYPDSMTDELIQVVADEEKICKYIDLPLQHCSKTVLERMNRTGSEEETLALLEKLRKAIPAVAIRTTLLAGFPGETEDDFQSLCRFVKKARFDRLGCFAFSLQEGTPAEKMPDQIDEETKKSRSEKIMAIQYNISLQKQKEKIGSVMQVIVDGYNENDMLYYGRTYLDCPEIDFKVIISTEQELLPGQFINVKIIGTDDCDLVGEAIFDG